MMMIGRGGLFPPLKNPMVLASLKQVHSVSPSSSSSSLRSGSLASLSTASNVLRKKKGIGAVSLDEVSLFSLSFFLVSLFEKRSFFFGFWFGKENINSLLLPFTHQDQRFSQLLTFLIMKMPIEFSFFSFFLSFFLSF